MLLRIASSAGRRFLWGDSFAINFSIESKAAKPRLYLGWRTVVKGTLKYSAVKTFPNPAREMSFGILMPWSIRVLPAPKATKSFEAMIAVAFVSSWMNCNAAVTPSSIVDPD